MTTLSRGSEWRKWDLHVHTPFSLFHNYQAKETEDVWERYIKDLESLPSEFKVLGINDYLFIDGYKKVLEYKSLGRLKNIELILPVIELRLAKFCGNAQLKRINFHVIFSNEISSNSWRINNCLDIGSSFSIQFHKIFRASSLIY